MKRKTLKRNIIVMFQVSSFRFQDKMFQVSRFKFHNNRGFSIIELLVSISIFSIILSVVISFLISASLSNTRSRVDREAQENARRVMDAITYEIRNSKSIYTSTTTSNQLSLETAKYLPADETTTFIDFFLCGTDLCLKKESQNNVILNSDSVEVTSLSFTQILTV